MRDLYERLRRRYCGCFTRPSRCARCVPPVRFAPHSTTVLAAMIASRLDSRFVTRESA